MNSREAKLYHVLYIMYYLFMDMYVIIFIDIYVEW